MTGPKRTEERTVLGPTCAALAACASGRALTRKRGGPSDKERQAVGGRLSWTPSPLSVGRVLGKAPSPAFSSSGCGRWLPKMTSPFWCWDLHPVTSRASSGLPHPQNVLSDARLVLGLTLRKFRGLPPLPVWGPGLLCKKSRSHPSGSSCGEAMQRGRGPETPEGDNPCHADVLTEPGLPATHAKDTGRRGKQILDGKKQDRKKDLLAEPPTTTRITRNNNTLIALSLRGLSLGPLVLQR